MGGLYWRVLALFWTSLVAVMVCSAWITTRLVERERASATSLHQQALADDIASAAVRMIGSHDLAAVQRWLKAQNGGPIRVQILALDPRPGAPAGSPHEPVHGIAAQRIATASNGQRFRVDVHWLPPPHPPRPVFRAFWMSFVGLGLLLGAGVALWLARYVALPLRQIRASAHRFATGDLDARVGTLRVGRSGEMVALAREFDQMAARVQRLIHDHRRLIGDVAHELRSPLARLGIAVELGRAEVKKEEREASHARILRELERMDRLIGQALDLSRLESGAQWSVEIGDLVPIVGARATDARFEATQRAIDIRVRAHSTALPICAHLDLVAGAIENVLRNALRFAPDHSVIEVQLARGENKTPRHAILEILDRGPGVPEHDLERIFEPFYRSSDSRLQGGSGGLGLAIARSSILRAGGRISASNRPGGGLIVRIELPLVDG